MIANFGAENVSEPLVEAKHFHVRRQGGLVLDNVSLNIG